MHTAVLQVADPRPVELDPRGVGRSTLDGEVTVGGCGAVSAGKSQQDVDVRVSEAETEEEGRW